MTAYVHDNNGNERVAVIQYDENGNVIGPQIVAARMVTNAKSTTIPTGTGYATKLKFYEVTFDEVGGVADIANNRMVIPAGFSYCRVSYSMAFAGNAVGYRGARIKNSAGSNYGNFRLLAVDAAASTNPQHVSSWIKIHATANVAPNQIAVGDYFELYPVQTSGGNLAAGADTASSWFGIEFK